MEIKALYIRGLSEEEHDQLKQEAKDKHLPLSAYIRMIVLGYITRPKS